MMKRSRLKPDHLTPDVPVTFPLYWSRIRPLLLTGVQMQPSNGAQLRACPRQSINPLNIDHLNPPPGSCGLSRQSVGVLLIFPLEGGGGGGGIGGEVQGGANGGGLGGAWGGGALREGRLGGGGFRWGDLGWWWGGGGPGGAIWGVGGRRGGTGSPYLPLPL